MPGGPELGVAQGTESQSPAPPETIHHRMKLAGRGRRFATTTHRQAVPGMTLLN